MASVTQTIPTLTGGISQQPDELKIPGQVSVATNVIPDVTHGLLKRPGSKLVKSLSDTTGSSITGSDDSTLNSKENGKWFSYYRDENESYIGQISRTGQVHMWDCATGNPIKVNYQSGNEVSLLNYCQHTKDEDIQTLTLNDFTFITNRTKTVSMSSTVESARPPEVFIDLRSTAYARQYAVNLYDTTDTTEITTATRIRVELVKSSNNYCSAVDLDTSDATKKGFMYEHADRINNSLTHIRCSEHAGDGRDAYAPNVGTRIFDITDGAQFTDEAAVGGIKALDGTEVDNDYSYAINVIAGGADGTGTTDVSTLSRVPTNLYFRIRTTGQSVPFTTGSGSDAETTYQARYTTTHDLL